MSLSTAILLNADSDPFIISGGVLSGMGGALLLSCIGDARNEIKKTKAELAAFNKIASNNK